MRTFARRVHLYLGLAASIPLILLSLSGAAIVFENELDQWLFSKLWRVQPMEQRLPYTKLIGLVRSAYPRKTVQRVRIPRHPFEAVVAALENGSEVFLNPYNGQFLGHRHYEQTPMGWLNKFHVTFFLGEAGSTFGGVSALVLVISLATGLVLWWPRGWNKWAGFWVQWRSSPRRKNFDIHRASGFYAAPVVCVIALTGAWFTFGEWVDPLLYRFAELKTEKRFVEAPLIPGRPFMNPDEALVRSAKQFPGSTATQLWLPGDKRVGYGIQLRKPHEPYDNGRTWLEIHPQTGEVININCWTDAPFVVQARSWRLHLHLGFWGGIWGETGALITKNIWLICSLMPTLLAITGVMIWRRIPGKREQLKGT